MTDRQERLQRIYDADAKVPDSIARALWAAATSDDHGIADGRSAVYRMLETALEDALFHIYRLTTPEAHHVRELLSEYGPDDSLTGTKLQGIASYAEFTILNPRKVSYW